MFQASPASLVKNLKQAVLEKDFAFSCTACSISILHTDTELIFLHCLFRYFGPPYGPVKQMQSDILPQKPSILLRSYKMLASIFIMMTPIA